MRDYKVRLVAGGPLTQLPDSQKLFGSLVYMFSEKYGHDNASILTKAVLEKKIHIALSNTMPEDYLPTPQDYIVDLISDTECKDINLKVRRAAIKKRSYISQENLVNILNGKQSCETVFPYVKLQTRQQPRASIESVRYDIAGLESKLYSVPTINLLEISTDKSGCEQQKPVDTFCFYLQADDSGICADLLEMLNKAVREKQSVILGKRASQGLNIFELAEITALNFSHKETKNFLNLGMLLPDDIDFEYSTLKLFTSERRPFEMTGGWENDVTGHFISFIAEGSIISAPGGAAVAGKAVKSPYNEKRDIVFGNAFLYPVLLQERQV